MQHHPRERELMWWHRDRFRRLAWVEWGAGDRVAVCVHGLTRSGRDFDALGIALAAGGWRVVCPDLPGRRRSEWLEAEDYHPGTYVPALAHLLAVIGGPVDWVGTSLGGICGMLVAAAAGQPIRRLVLNDIGPHIPATGLARIAGYLAAMPERFPDRAAAEALVRRAPYGALDDSQWAHLTDGFLRPHPDGGFVPHFDPAIGRALTAAAPTDQDLWPVWDRIAVPRMVVRGADSDLLLPETLARMRPDCAHIVPGAGHAPALMDIPTIDAIRDFLRP